MVYAVFSFGIVADCSKFNASRRFNLSSSSEYPILYQLEAVDFLRRIRAGDLLVVVLRTAAESEPLPGWTRPSVFHVLPSSGPDSALSGGAGVLGARGIFVFAPL